MFNCSVFPKTKRKGLSLVECIILMIVLVVTLGAIFTTMAWAQKSYVFSKQDKDSRELLFNWVQTFESLWPPEVPDGTDLKDPVFLTNSANEIIDEVFAILGGNPANRVIKGFTVNTTPTLDIPTGKIDLRIVVRAGSPGKTLVEVTRHYNLYTTDTVSDDVLSGA